MSIIVSSSVKLIDEFSDMPVSRQRKHQLRANKAGLCAQCLTRPVRDRKITCAECGEKQSQRNKKWREANQERQKALMARWRRKHPDYNKKWREAHPNYMRDYMRARKKRL